MVGSDELIFGACKTVFFEDLYNRRLLISTLYY